MGRNKKFFRKRDRDANLSRKPDEYRSDPVTKLTMSNTKFFAYYKAQSIVPDDEWDTFVESLREHLPTTFRLAGNRETKHTLGDTITSTHIPLLQNIVFEDKLVPPPVQLPWYPDGLAWQFNVPKKVLRRQPEFNKFHSFLVGETEVGNISRQEAVSMLPPLFLDIQPHHMVMDMCAAPGSKTAQLLEALHADGPFPAGLLVANDSDAKRTHMLIHQSARLPSPALMVTNLDASNYPTLRIAADETVTSISRTSKVLTFDRILCDVPCSGDGTLRKNLGIWKSWQPMDGNGLHSLQVRILKRAMKLLKPNGRIVYSTCSFNPVENEAVVAAALNDMSEFHVVDVSDRFPSLKRRPGMSAWNCAVDKTCDKFYESYGSYSATLPPEQLATSKMSPTHWPPANVAHLGLERCMRLYPHLQDTGGFFVAVLERRSKPAKRCASTGSESQLPKKAKLEDAMCVDEKALGEAIDRSDTPSDPAVLEIGASVLGFPGGIPPISADINVDEDNGTATPSDATPKPDGKCKGKDPTYHENPYTFLPPSDAVLLRCLERLHLQSAFPINNVLVRNPAGEPARTMYLANDAIKAVIEHNDFTKIRLMSAGTKVFAKHEGGSVAVAGESQFRILGEGLDVVLPYVRPDMIVTCDLCALRRLLEHYYPMCDSFEGQFKDALQRIDTGSSVIRISPQEWEGTVLAHEMVLPIWKSNVSVSLMVDKKSKSAMSLRLFGRDITPAKDAKKKPRGALPLASPTEPVAEVEAVSELVEGDAEARNAA